MLFQRLHNRTECIGQLKYRFGSTVVVGWIVVIDASSIPILEVDTLTQPALGDYFIYFGSPMTHVHFMF